MLRSGRFLTHRFATVSFARNLRTARLPCGFEMTIDCIAAGVLLHFYEWVCILEHAATNHE